MYYTIIPTIFHALFDVTAIQKTEDREVVLLREPKDAAYYEFSAKDDLVITNKYPGFTPDEVLKSFHADTYCFDSLPEKECFFQYIKSDKVQEVYFTEMFTSNQGDLSVYYYDPESGRIWQYYPDFLAKMKDGTYQLIEVKGDSALGVSVYTLSNPSRVVVDIPNAVSELDSTFDVSTLEYVTAGRAAMFNDTTLRLVFEVDGMAKYSYTTDNHAMTLQIFSSSMKNMSYDTSANKLY